MAPCNSGWNFPDNITKQEQKDTGWPGADHTAHDGGGSLRQDAVLLLRKGGLILSSPPDLPALDPKSGRDSAYRWQVTIFPPPDQGQEQDRGKGKGVASNNLEAGN